MTTVAGQGLDGLRSMFSGRVITAAGGDYDQARSVWNGAIDAHPAVIARCARAVQAGWRLDVLRGQLAGRPDLGILRDGEPGWRGLRVNLVGLQACAGRSG